MNVRLWHVQYTQMTSILELPLEIRLHVGSYLFNEDVGIHLLPHKPPIFTGSVASQIRLVCKSWNNDFIATTLSLKPHLSLTDDCCLRQFISQIGLDEAKLIKSLEYSPLDPSRCTGNMKWLDGIELLQGLRELKLKGFGDGLWRMCLEPWVHRNRLYELSWDKGDLVAVLGALKAIRQRRFIRTAKIFILRGEERDVPIIRICFGSKVAGDGVSHHAERSYTPRTRLDHLGVAVSMELLKSLSLKWCPHLLPIELQDSSVPWLNLEELEM